MPILEWLNKNEAINTTSKVPYRILKANKELSYGEKNENMIIKGDNLEALKALLPYYKGQVKCIYIDPPYNTGNAFEHYDDNLEHSKWLSMIYPRLELLYEMLAEDGFICCQIDDAEGHYLKIIMDEIFGRQNYMTTFYIQVRYSDKTLKSDMKFHKQIEQIHIYRKSRMAQPNMPQKDTAYDKFIYEVVTKKADKVLELGGKKVEIFSKGQYLIKKHQEGAAEYLKEIWASGTILDGNSSGRFFRDYLSGRYKDDGLSVLYKVYGIGDDQYNYRFFTGPQREGATKGKYYQGVPLSKLDGNTSQDSPIENYYDFSGSFGNCRLEGGADFRAGKKPEALLGMILEYFSKENDLVLDSFLGSGSTIAVAHKLKRKYIGIEMGTQAITHCVPRLKKIIDNKDNTGISKPLNWQGGGGYTFYDLGETVFDENGNINKNVDFKTLASHIWFSETKTPLLDFEKSPLLGVYNGTAYYLLYNGILGDKKPDGGNVLTQKIFDTLPKFDGKKVIYGEATRMNEEKRKINNITFKQTPYDIKAR